jgi:hypothetical protein
VYREDHWQRDWVRHLRACSEKAAEVAQCVSLSVLRAYEIRDDAVETARTARARTAEASAKACNAGARHVTACGRRTALSNDAQHDAARTASPPLMNYQRCQRMRTTHAGLASRLPSISRPSTRDAVLGDSISDDWDRPGSYGDVNPGTDGLTARTNSVPRRPAMTNDMCSWPGLDEVCIVNDASKSDRPE